MKMKRITRIFRYFADAGEFEKLDWGRISRKASITNISGDFGVGSCIKAPVADKFCVLREFCKLKRLINLPTERYF